MGKEYEQALQEAEEALMTPQIYTTEEVDTYKKILQMTHGEWFEYV